MATTTAYNLMLLGATPLPPTVLVGVWSGDVQPPSAPATPLLNLTVPVDLTQDDATIIAAIHAAVDAHFTAIDTENAAAARVAAYQGVVIPHTHTSL